MRGKWKYYSKFKKRQYNSIKYVEMDVYDLLNHFVNMPINSHNIPSMWIYYEICKGKVCPKIAIKLLNEYELVGIIGTGKNNSIDYNMLPILESKISKIKKSLLEKKIFERPNYDMTILLLDKTLERIKQFIINHDNTFSSEYNIKNILNEIKEEELNKKYKILNTLK